MQTATLEFTIHLSSFKNLSFRSEGCIRVRFSLFQACTNNFATPTQIILKTESVNSNRSRTQSHEYISHAIAVERGKNNYFINQMCIFRNDMLISKLTETQYQFSLQVEYTASMDALKGKAQCLYSVVHSSKLKIVKIHSVSEYMPIAFDKFHEEGIHASFSAICLGIKKPLCSFVNTRDEQYFIKNSSILKLIKKEYNFIKQALNFLNTLQFSQSQTMDETLSNVSILKFQKTAETHNQSFDLTYYLTQIQILWPKYLFSILHNHRFIDEIARQYERKVRRHYYQKSDTCIHRKTDWKIRSNPDLLQQYQSYSENIIQLQCSPSQSGISVINEQYFKDSNQTSVIITEVNQSIQPFFKKDHPLKHIIILVHGFQASKADMSLIKSCLNASIKNCQIFTSQINTGYTDKSISYQGERLALQIDQYLKTQNDDYRLSFVGHSMGGVVARASIEHLGLYSDYFYSFVSLASPHLGFIKYDSWIVQTGLWYMAKWKKYQSISQLTFSDNQDLEECYIYKLSKNKSLNKFENIAFVSCFQDYFVPYESSRIQKTEQIRKLTSTESTVFQKMVDNILENMTCRRLYRINVFFKLCQANLQNFLGKTAHINYLQDIQFIKQFISNFEHFFR